MSYSPHVISGASPFFFNVITIFLFADLSQLLTLMVCFRNMNCTRAEYVTNAEYTEGEQSGAYNLFGRTPYQHALVYFKSSSLSTFFPVAT